MWTKPNRQRFKSGVVLVATIIFATALGMSDIRTDLFMTSVLDFPEHQPFDGTVYPMQKAPDWVGLDSADWDKSYGELDSSDLVVMPYYDPSQLKISTDDLKWGDPNDNKIRNAKITYSVPYMGSYHLDGLEYAGSHLAVDIKVPNGTPVYAMANGTVTKSTSQSSGFGNHIVIMHNNAPLPNGLTGTIYSSYSHMGGLQVNAGDVVVKGQQIGSSGESGTATTPHLHFQIDNDEAPWHPYWPFTWSEANEAGYSFSEAVNAGLGKSNALANTLNPMDYVQAHLDGSVDFVVADPPVVKPEVVVEEDNNEVVPTAVSYVAGGGDEVEEESVSVESEVVVEEAVEVEVEVELEVPEPVVEELKLRFVINVQDEYVVGQSNQFSILMQDQNGAVFSDGFKDFVSVISVQGFVTPSETILNALSFGSDGKKSNSFARMTPGKDRLKIEHDGEIYYSNWFEVIEEGASQRFTDVSTDHRNFAAINYLVDLSVVNGYQDGTFQPSKTVNRAEALKFVVLGNGIELSTGDLSFSDVVRSEWYWDYLYSAKSRSIISGYEDGTFRPATTVNKAEFLKILFKGKGIQVADMVSEAPYGDVPVDAWFAPYFAEAKKLKLFDDVANISPAAAMSRGEVAETMYRLLR